MINKFELFNLLRSGNPQAVFDTMMKNNEQFRKFVEENKGKTPEEIAKEHNIDYNTLQQLFK